MPLSFTAAALPDLPAAAQWLLAHLAGRTVVLLDGEMGAGKTTFVRALAATLGVPDHVSSPTYGLVHEYRTAAGQPLYHFDLYRLRDAAEAEALGVLEYFDSGDLCLVEWPERLGPLLTDAVPAAAHLHFSVAPTGARVLTLAQP